MVAISTGGITIPVGQTEPIPFGQTEPIPLDQIEPISLTPSEPFPLSQSEPIDPREHRASGPLETGPRYAVGESIGRGGMGEVVAAHDMQIGREVAIKRLHDDEPSVAARARFLREARIQGRLEHPSIPPVYELANGDDGLPYFAMRKLDGVTLAATLRDPDSPFTRQRLLRAFIDICNAIDLAHSRRIIHRDLKPSNILLGQRGEVYVLDWGIARELDAPDAFAGPSLGTPGYMAPEQICGVDDLDARVDIYALGCILFEILTRKPLHPRGKPANASALRGKFPAVSDLPPELADACRRATALAREERFSSVRELIAIVQGFLDGDRDLEQRRSLARKHLDRATLALVQVDNEESRRAIAMREAGQALALDPTLTGAAELIGRIMLQPPAVTPASVRREIDQLDWGASSTLARLSSVSGFVFVAMVPVLIVLGVRDVPYMIGYGALATTILVLALAQTRVTRPRLMIAFLASYVCMFALVARMFTPLLCAPALAAVFMATSVFNPIVRRGRVLLFITAGSLTAVFGVWFAERVGLLSQSTTWEHGRLIMVSPVDGVDEHFPALYAIGLAMALVICLGASFAHSAMRHVRAAREQLMLQAWHLRQLAPSEQRAHDAKHGEHQ